MLILRKENIEYSKCIHLNIILYDIVQFITGTINITFAHIHDTVI